MNSFAIQVNSLGKVYRLGKRERYRTLRDSITDVCAAPFRALRGRMPARQKSEALWALKDISFEVKHGEVIGIVGRNGAGKSTLLKILSRITDPTEGSATINGRVGSLLEVGTGFHPELSGRENIFLNGAILGMRRKEIERKFDDIVEFAEVAKFIDTPVKHFSSGMYMRLAFSVAAHLDPEILIVDEVLAVGDLGFQKKCLGKMGDVAKTGRTVVLVTHQTNQIRRVCQRCIWLDGGKVREVGPVSETLSRYEADTFRTQSAGKRDAKAGGAAAKFIEWTLVDSPDDRANILDTSGPFQVRFVLVVNQRIPRGIHGIAVLKDGRSNMWGNAVYDLDLQPGTYEFVHSLAGLPLQPGAYSWQVSISDENGMIDLWDCTPELAIITPPVTHRRDEYAGVLNLASQFSSLVRVDEMAACEVANG